MNDKTKFEDDEEPNYDPWGFTSEEYKRLVDAGLIVFTSGWYAGERHSNDTHTPEEVAQLRAYLDDHK